eukprot:Hpha_TRINITY_DN14699_c1_g2::TRINITY_DN14699_c1_g2_i10::g.47635::m.47635
MHLTFLLFFRASVAFFFFFFFFSTTLRSLSTRSVTASFTSSASSSEGDHPRKLELLRSTVSSSPDQQHPRVGSVCRRTGYTDVQTNFAIDKTFLPFCQPPESKKYRNC